jgi:formylglycine-generating enzyme required for sulfatase activity
MITGALAGLLLVLIGGPTAWLWKTGVTVQYATSIVFARLHMVLVAEPEMVTIPRGTYRPGSDERRSEEPVREVTIPSFAIGKYEVTFAEYDRYVELMGGRRPDDRDWGRERHPVINVSWEDAVAYATWLSRATGKRYRLPTESEWEYAARSGGQDEIWAGTSDESQLKDYAVYGKKDGLRTKAVGSKKPNGLGLYDMSGNVEEWVGDCWHAGEAPSDGSAWLKPNGGICSMHVIRGGDFHSISLKLRTSDRISYSWISDSHMFINIGFRLAQDIP